MGVLTVSIKEELTLNGVEQGGINTVAISSVTQCFKRIVTLPNGGEATVAVIKDAVTTSAGAVDGQQRKLKAPPRCIGHGYRSGCYFAATWKKLYHGVTRRRPGY